MKKFLTLRNVLLFGGALLAIIAFFVAFAAGLNGTLQGIGAIKTSGLIIGTRKAIFDGETYSGREVEMLFGKYRPGLSLAGIIIMLVSGLAAVVVALFVKKPWTKWVLVGLAGLMLMSAIFVFCLKNSEVAAMVDYVLDQGDGDRSQRQQYINEYYEIFKDMHLNAGSWFTGIFGVLGTGAIAASQFVPEKQLLK